MPFVTLTVRKPKTTAFKDAVLGAVHAALVKTGVPKNDLFHRVFELDAADFRFDTTYPELQSGRSEDFALIEILLSVGRSVKVKKQIVQDVVAALAGAGMRPDDVMICFKETQWENWSFAGGTLLHT